MWYYPHFVCEEGKTRRGGEGNCLPKIRGLVSGRIRTGTQISRVLVQGESHLGSNCPVTEPGHFILFWDRWDLLEIKPLTLCHVGLCRVGEVKTAMPSHRYRRIGRVS